MSVCNIKQATEAPQPLQELFGTIAHWYCKLEENCTIDAIQCAYLSVSNYICQHLDISVDRCRVREESAPDIEIVDFKTQAEGGTSCWLEDNDNSEGYGRVIAAHNCMPFCHELAKAFAAIQAEKEAKEAAERAQEEAAAD